MPQVPRLAAALALLGALACASDPPPGPLCRIEVVGLEEYRETADRVEVAFRVEGEAGEPGSVYLEAKGPDDGWRSGLPLDVGPGIFGAIIDVELLAPAEEYRAVLSVEERVCSDEAPRP